MAPEGAAHPKDVTDGKPDVGNGQIAHRDGKGWLEAEWQEGTAKEAGIPVTGKP
jgi:hypothetical protein